MGHDLLVHQESAPHRRGVLEVGVFPPLYCIVSERIVRWTNQRTAFGKPLHSQAVIRNKLAAMISRAEAVQWWLENITYQMNNMVSEIYRSWSRTQLTLSRSPTKTKPNTWPGKLLSLFLHNPFSLILNRPIGLLKMTSTKYAQLTATDAVQIFGGRGITRTGTFSSICLSPLLTPFQVWASISSTYVHMGTWILILC